MNPLVRDLYKRALLAGRGYPQGLSHVRDKAKAAFIANKDLTDDVDIKKAVGKGRYWVRELNAISKLHKYRQMNKRYGLS
jgi:hypothetical protein